MNVHISVSNKTRRTLLNIKIDGICCNDGKKV